MLIWPSLIKHNEQSFNFMISFFYTLDYSYILGFCLTVEESDISTFFISVPQNKEQNKQVKI